MAPGHLLRQLAKANFHKGGIKCLRLFRVDPEFFDHLAAECLGLARSASASSVSDQAHVTNWTKPYGRAVQYSLLNASGDFADTSADHTHTIHGKRFHRGEAYPTLAKFIAVFGDAISMRLNGLGPTSGLSPHEEHVVHYDPARRAHYLRTRFHLPIETNRGCEMLLDGELFHFEKGYVYFFNNGAVHSASNAGSEFRYHLVWDMLLTPATYNLMFLDVAPAPPFLQRVAPDALRVEVTRSCRIREFQISGDGERLYTKLGLARFGVRPYHFQRLYNEISYRVPRKLELATVAGGAR